MKLVSQIVVRDGRQRATWDEEKIEDLAQSIEAQGLMHPIVVRDTGERHGLTGEPVYELVAGFRRHRAMCLLHEGQRTFGHEGAVVPHESFPATEMKALGGRKEMTDTDYFAAELMENMMREDLSPTDHAAAVAELHKRRTSEKGEYSQKTKEGHSKKDTAEELSTGEKKYHQSTLVDDLLIAEYKHYPTVAVAKTRKDALKAIRLIKVGQLRKKEKDEYVAKGGAGAGELILGNCLEQDFSDKPFGQIIADPPYGIDIHTKEMSDGDFHEYDDSYESWKELMGKFPQWCYKNTKEQAFVWVFCDYKRFTELLAAFTLANFECWKRPLIWNKEHIGGFGNMVTGFRTTYECILFANKGKKVMENPQGEVFSVVPEIKEHPAGKPAELYRKLLWYGATPGDRVCDPFCGSGTLFDAVREKGELKRKLEMVPIGIEMNEDYHKLALMAKDREVEDENERKD